MYAIRTTPGFIIGSSPYGEAGKVLSIFTRDLGFVTAIASGVRLEKAKLRYHSQDYSLGVFSLVRGKEFWRLTSASGSEKRDRGQTIDSSPRALLARLALLLRRLLQGEDPNPELFDHLKSCADFLAATTSLDAEQMKTLESLTVLRMLASLGYVGSDVILDAHVGHSDLRVELLDELRGQRPSMNRHINKALKESHL
jgi:recombinational DNA repair protein (RecF pathway)